MTVKHVPPKDPNEVRLNQIKDLLRGVLSTHIFGRGKDKKIDQCADECVAALGPLLKLAPKPTKGATVMNEAATLGRKRPSSL